MEGWESLWDEARLFSNAMVSYSCSLFLALLGLESSVCLFKKLLAGTCVMSLDHTQ